MDSCEEESDDEDPVACENTRKQLFSLICNAEDRDLLSSDTDSIKYSAKTSQAMSEQLFPCNSCKDAGAKLTIRLY